MDKATLDVYERQAGDWVRARTADDLQHVRWVQRHRAEGPVVDIGCGPGWHLPAVAPPAVALDPTAAMLDLVPVHAPDALRVRAEAGALPFGSGLLGGAVANRVYLHLPVAEVPLALADLHRALQPEGPVFVSVIGDEQGQEFRGQGDFAGRLFSGWSDDRLCDVCRGAGFTVERFIAERHQDRPAKLVLRLRRAFTLPDTVGAGMRLLICGLNPSTYAAEVGIGFGRPGNRFWPAAVASGAVSRPRDPRHALTVDGIGMTDLVKRPTRAAAELTAAEYRLGLARVERLVSWLEPAAVCFVGLAGWRLAVNRTAAAGPQPEDLGGVPVYVMPSTSGLNAHSGLADLTRHLADALTMAGG